MNRTINFRMWDINTKRFYYMYLDELIGLTRTISIPKDENGEYNGLIGMISVMGALYSGNRDDTMQIKSHFLHRNGIKQEHEYRKDFGRIYRRY